MTPASRKTRALIGYLCLAGKPVARERLASLLWGDRGDEQARASLRQTLYELRSIPGGDRLLKVERETIAVGEEVGTDVAAIATAARAGDLERLGREVSEWRGDLFEDLPSIDPSFDAWLQSERLRIQESLIEAAAQAVKTGIARNEIDAARKVAGLLQQRDSANELVLRLGLRLDRLAGDSAALHRRYERFRESLKAELNAAPSPATQRLFHELTSGSPASAEAAAALAVPDSVTGPVQNAEPAAAAGDVEPVEPELDRDADAELPPPEPAIRSRRSFAFAAALIGVIVLGVLSWAGWNSFHPAIPQTAVPLLAVLPFQNLSPDAGSQFFSKGLSGRIADALPRNAQVRIVAPPLPGSDDASAPRPLAATHLLSGSVERVGSRIHVIAQLVDIQDGRVVWSHAYDKAAGQAATPRQDVAAQIARAAGRLLLSGSIDTAQQVSPAAYDHYLKGRTLFRRNDARAAAAELEEAVRLAPKFAKAWSTLAAARWLLASSALSERKKAYNPSMASAARSAAERALTLNGNDGGGLGVLALLTPPARLLETDWRFERALRAEPHNTQLLAWHAGFLMFVGRNQEALDELTRAYELDRATPGVASNLVLASLKTRRFDEAREIIDLIGGRPDSRSRGEVLRLRVKYFLYRQDWFRLANYLNALPHDLAPRMAVFLRLCRDTAIALSTHETGRFSRLRASWRSESSVDLGDAVQFLSALGDFDGALQAVESAVSARRNDPLLTDPGWESLFDPNLVPLRRDPRGPALFAQWGLLDYWRTANRWPDFIR